MCASEIASIQTLESIPWAVPEVGVGGWGDLPLRVGPLSARCRLCLSSLERTSASCGADAGA